MRNNSCFENLIYSLKNIEIGESVESIESYAFANCSSLESISIPENVKNIENNA